MEKLQLIDFSLEDDFLVSSSVTDSLEDYRLSLGMDDKDEHNSFKRFVNAKKAIHMFDKGEERRFNGSVRASNSRDSLAWDSAFFTNAGVLDPDELFTMNKGFERPEVRKRKSTFSDYFFEEDGFLLENNDIDGCDIFQDVRASIRKSNSKTNLHLEDHKKKAHVSKKLDYMSQNRVKLIPTARKQSIYKQGSEMYTKSTASPINSKLRENNGKLKSFSPRPPKISGRVNATSTGSTKNVPLNVGDITLKHKSAIGASGKGLLSSNKKSRLGEPRCSISSTSSLMASSSLPLTKSSDSISYCSPFNNASALRSSTNSKIKLDTKKNSLSGSVSAFKTPPRCSLQVQTEFENPNSSTKLSSFSNHSSYYSATSSIDESPDSYMNDVNPRDRNGDASGEQARGFNKPSGLKPPSPKIGFFDKEPSSAEFQFHIGSRSASPHINGVTTKRKPRDSISVTSQARELSTSSSATSGFTERKQMTNNKSTKLRFLKLKNDGTTSLPIGQSTVKARKRGDGAQVEKQFSIRSSLSAEKMRIKADLENRIEKEMKRHVHLSTIVPCMNKNKPSTHKSEEHEKENLKGVENNVEGLSRYFEGINLKNDSSMEHSTTVSYKPRARMPLADKNFVLRRI